MKPLIYRCPWNLPRNHRAEFALYSHGIAEQMQPIVFHNNAAMDDWLLIYFHDEAIAGGRKCVLDVPAGTLMLWAPGAMRIYGRAHKRWTHSWIQVTGTRMVPILESAGIKPETPIPVGEPNTVEHGILELHNEMTGFQHPSARILGNLFENWLLGLVRGHQDAETAYEQRLRTLKYHLDTQTANAISLHEMARQTGISTSHLSAVFKTAYGESPVAYHIARRMDAARYLLTSRSLPVADVAVQVGYPDLPSFSRMFKRMVGMSPRNYCQFEQQRLQAKKPGPAARVPS